MGLSFSRFQKKHDLEEMKVSKYLLPLVKRNGRRWARCEGTIRGISEELWKLRSVQTALEKKEAKGKGSLAELWEEIAQQTADVACEYQTFFYNNECYLFEMSPYKKRLNQLINLELRKILELVDVGKKEKIRKRKKEEKKKESEESENTDEEVENKDENKEKKEEEKTAVEKMSDSIGCLEIMMRDFRIEHTAKPFGEEAFYL
ncbi:hypothetical protein CRE_31421 [Caenorhabditis remanei]|uniref:Uncharacterized protein n=1 Tax=Caenorhabditis remanei TaxID=31234 RepID=E3N5U8_CAERE|nr:hypothetical protein CRE_31421 [Caenorhabditis remanei]